MLTKLHLYTHFNKYLKHLKMFQEKIVAANESSPRIHIRFLLNPFLKLTMISEVISSSFVVNTRFYFPSYVLQVPSSHP
jgi:hypothetical protein